MKISGYKLINKLINIGGSSGVGKTTLTTFLKFIFQDILHVAGDDLHKWERHDANWDRMTHLNPEANNLDLGKLQLLELINDRSIKRDMYDHNTGKFNKGITVKPKSVIINEGLHALYDKQLCNLAKLNIFVETEENLKYQWKLNRDIQKRGYTKEQVKSAIDMRRFDEKMYITTQKLNADVVVKFIEKRDKAVHFTFTSKTEYGTKIMTRLQKLYNLHRDFLLTCRKSAFEYELIQGAGGNLSYKFEDMIIITASGKTMSDTNILNGFSVVSLPEGYKFGERPSMELGFHIKLLNKIVYHTHPIYTNVILCSNESKQVMSDILWNFDYDYIEYITPGKDLSQELIAKEDIILLENHGLICCSDSFEKAFNISLKINQLCKEWLIKNSKTFKTFRDKVIAKDDSCILYPDAAILPDDNLQINNYMLHIQEEVGLTSRCLSKNEITKLKNMEAEKYRIKQQ